MFKAVILLASAFALSSTVVAQNFTDLPGNCQSPCQAFATSATACQTAGSADAVSCVCNVNFISQLSACGGCILTTSGPTSPNGQVVEQTAITLAQLCKRSFALPGADASTNSTILAAGANGTSSIAATGAATQTISRTGAASGSSAVSSVSSVISQGVSALSSLTSSLAATAQTGSASAPAATTRSAGLTSAAISGSAVLVGAFGVLLAYA